MIRRFVRRKEAARIVGLSEPHIRRLEREGKFPKAVTIGAHAVAYIESELITWQDERIEARETNA